MTARTWQSWEQSPECKSKTLGHLGEHPHLLSVSKYGFSYAGAHVDPFVLRCLSPLRDARPISRMSFGAEEGSRGKGSLPPTPPCRPPGTRMLQPPWAFILTSGGCNLGRDRDLLPDRQWEACLPSRVPD